MNNDYHGYVYKKNIDWSSLNEGISIPVTIQKNFIQQGDYYLARGHQREINIVINDKSYKAILKNQNFNAIRYRDHKDIVQIRYSPASEIAVELKRIFNKSYENLEYQMQYISQNLLIHIF